MQRLPHSVAELVESAPSLSKEGALLLGSRHTTVFVIEAATGELVRIFSEAGGDLSEVEHASGVRCGFEAPVSA